MASNKFPVLIAFSVISGSILTSGAPSKRVSRPKVSSQLHFYRLHFPDLTERAASSWGHVEFVYTPDPRWRYFNLTVNGEWQVRNFPLCASGGGQSENYYVDLGTKESAAIPEARYGYSITPGPQERMPASTEHAVIGMRDYIRQCGPRKYAPPERPAPLEGAPVEALACRAAFPNQECGRNECAPAAASNSLQWLNRKFHLGLADDDLSIDKMKEATGWTPDGATHGAWADRKTRYVESHNVPIDTKKLDRGKVREAADAFNRDCDVEIDTGNHVASVICMGESNGKWVLRVVSDLKQGQPGGTESAETLTFDPATSTVTGTPWANGSRVDNFVVECKK
jgi:hypothetical protein